MGNVLKVPLTMYGVAEVLHWCHDRNKGRVPGVDTAGFEKMKALLTESRREQIISRWTSFGRKRSF